MKHLANILASSNQFLVEPQSLKLTGFQSRPLEQSELFNEFFNDHFSDMSSYDIDIAFDYQYDIQIVINFYFSKTRPLVKVANPNESAGPDGIHEFMVPGTVGINCAVNLANPLSVIFRSSYLSGIISSVWKIANVVLEHKEGRKMSVEKYQPIGTIRKN